MIGAKRVGVMGGMGCPQNSAVTPQTGGELRATISGADIAGEFTEVYGAGVVTFGYTLQAKPRMP